MRLQADMPTSKSFQISVLLTAISTFVSMLLFESVKQFMLPDVTIWESHWLTICYATLSAAAAAYFLFWKIDDLNRRTMAAYEDKSRAEAALQKTHESLEEQNRFYQAMFQAQSDVDEGQVVRDGARPVFFNDAACRLLGYSRDELLAMRGPFDMIHPDDRERVTEMNRRRRQGEPAPTHYTCGLQTKDGRRIEAEIAVAPMEQEGRHHLVAIFRDVTKHVRAEQEVRKLNAELEQRVRERTAQLEDANRDLQSFSYSVSHDLRGPARRIAGFSAILLSDYGGSLIQPVRDHLSRIARGAQQMGELIEDMLALSRASQAKIKISTVDLTGMARAICAELRESAPNRNAEFVIEDGMTAQGDHHLLRIALENLYANAWKYTSTREFTQIEFGCEKADIDATFHMRDNGIGFDMAYANRIFEPFERLHSQSQFEGTGIGLATVQRVIRRHRGKIWVEAKPDEGATFFFMLANPASENVS